MRANTPHAAGPFSRLPPPAATALLLLGSLLALILFYLGVVLNIPMDADAGSLMLMAQAILDGNLLLSSWTLGTISFFTTELPFYVAGVALLGLTWKVIYLLAALHWASVVLLVCYLSVTDEAPGSRLAKLLVAFSLSLFVASLAIDNAYLSTGHLVAYAYCLIGLICIRRLERTDARRYYVCLGGFLTLAMIGDTFALYLMAIPVAGVCLIRMLMGGTRRTSARLLLTVLASVVCAVAALALVRQLGGPRVPGPAAVPIGLSEFGPHMRVVLAAALKLFAVPSHEALVAPPGFMTDLVHAIALIMFVLVLGWVIRHFARQSLYVQVLAAMVLVNVLENVASARGGTVRYLLPALIFGIPLVSHVVFTWIHSGLLPKTALAYFLILLLSLMPRLSVTRAPSLADAIARDLLALDLTNGYGPHWGASGATVAAAGKVTVRPVYLQDGDEIAPFLCVADPTWYGAPANFLILNTADSSGLQPTRAQAISTFGEPSAVQSLGAYGDLLVWDHDITPQLAIPKPCDWQP
jgi:hypothetical protein